MAHGDLYCGLFHKLEKIRALDSSRNLNFLFIKFI